MNPKDSETIIRLAREGKQIAKINTEDFPEYDYWEIYMEAHVAGEKSSLGVKRMITARLKKLADTKKQQEREVLFEEINGLIWHLYSRYKDSQIKLDEVRAIINK